MEAQTFPSRHADTGDPAIKHTGSDSRSRIASTHTGSMATPVLRFCFSFCGMEWGKLMLILAAEPNSGFSVLEGRGGRAAYPDVLR